MDGHNAHDLTAHSVSKRRIPFEIILCFKMEISIALWLSNDCMLSFNVQISEIYGRYTVILLKVNHNNCQHEYELYKHTLQVTTVVIRKK